jgi:hypothetical protein
MTAPRSSPKMSRKEMSAMRLHLNRRLPLPDPEQVRRRTRATFVPNDGHRSML